MRNRVLPHGLDDTEIPSATESETTTPPKSLDETTFVFPQEEENKPVKRSKANQRSKFKRQNAVELDLDVSICVAPVEVC